MWDSCRNAQAANSLLQLWKDSSKATNSGETVFPSQSHHWTLPGPQHLHSPGSLEPWQTRDLVCSGAEKGDKIKNDVPCEWVDQRRPVKKPLFPNSFSASDYVNTDAFPASDPLPWLQIRLTGTFPGKHQGLVFLYWINKKHSPHLDRKQSCPGSLKRKES